MTSSIIKTGLFLEISNVLQRYSAKIPREIFVTPKPNVIIEISIGQPAFKSLINIFLRKIYSEKQKPTANKNNPTIVTNLIGTKEKAIKESTSSLNFLLVVHLEVPLCLAILL